MILVRRGVPVSCLLALLPALGCVEAPERGQRSGVGPDVGAFAVAETRPKLPPGVQRGPLSLVACGDIEGSFDTVGKWAGKERFVTSNEWIAVGFGRTALYDGRGDRTLVGANDSLDLTLYEGSTVRTRVRGGSSTQMVTTQESEEWTNLFVGMFPAVAQADWRAKVERGGVRQAYPAFGSIKVDADGGMWIGEYAKLADEERLWVVLEGDGTPIGSVRLPVFRPEWLQIREGSITGRALVEWEVTIPSPVHELLDIADDRIVVLRKDELGREYVEVYEVKMAENADSQRVPQHTATTGETR